MLTVFVILTLAAFIVTVASAVGKAPLWVAVVILCLVELLRVLPLGR
jgi:heme/copper-type cytochrome/quinol oxidase subunit 4